MVHIVAPLSGLRTRNHTIALRMEVSEPLSELRVLVVGQQQFSVHNVGSELLLQSEGDGYKTAVLSGVDRAGNVQRNATMFWWETDTSTTIKPKFLSLDFSSVFLRVSHAIRVFQPRRRWR